MLNAGETVTVVVDRCYASEVLRCAHMAGLSNLLITHQASRTHESARARARKGGGRGRELTDDAGNPAQNREQDVDDEVRVAAGLEEDGDGRNEDCEEVEAHVGLQDCISELRIIAHGCFAHEASLLAWMLGEQDADGGTYCGGSWSGHYVGICF